MPSDRLLAPKEKIPTGYAYSLILRNEQVLEALKSINPKKSCGWDSEIPPNLLKKVASRVAPSLINLYNYCIKLSQWPTAWKMGEWTSVFKKCDR